MSSGTSTSTSFGQGGLVRLQSLDRQPHERRLDRSIFVDASSLTYSLRDLLNLLPLGVDLETFDVQILGQSSPARRTASIALKTVSASRTLGDSRQRYPSPGFLNRRMTRSTSSEPC